MRTTSEKKDPVNSVRGKRFGPMLILLVGALSMPHAAPAQDLPEQNLLSRWDIHRAASAVAGRFSVSGYYFTAGSASRALGTPKFSSDTQFFVRPKHYRQFQLTGGLEIVDVTDHFFPFQGGNEYSLIGPAFHITTPRVIGRLKPVVSGGLFAGRVRSLSLGFDRTDFTPSLAAGIEYPFTRYLTLIANYRVSKVIHSVNTDGFTIGLKLF